MTNDLESNPFLKQEERNALETCRSFAFIQYYSRESNILSNIIIAIIIISIIVGGTWSTRFSSIIRLEGSP